MSMQVIQARTRLHNARSKHAVIKHSLQLTQNHRADMVDFFLTLGFPLETAELNYQTLLENAAALEAAAVNEIASAAEELRDIDPRPDSMSAIGL